MALTLTFAENETTETEEQGDPAEGAEIVEIEPEDLSLTVQILDEVL